jgi:hypothetical protein
VFPADGGYNSGPSASPIKKRVLPSRPLDFEPEAFNDPRTRDSWAISIFGTPCLTYSGRGY